MIERQDRRAAGVNRVSVARLVDICGRDASVPAFEAESVELSGRGMHVRTPYLPPIGAPLVCRLEDGGREIVVEGVVAWQQHEDGAGEFGIQFTALDSGSVEALRAMCGIGVDAPGAASQVKAAPAEAAAPSTPTGLPVKLHIDGLGAPMKARVKNGTTRKLQVGSNLEFLRVGRGLQVEDVEQGERRGARIDAVSIAIDPETQVPQLVVALRYDGEDTTPEPSVIGRATGEEPRAAARAAEASEASAPASTDDAFDDDELDGDEPELRGKIDAFAVSVGRAAKSTGEKLAAASGSAASRFAKWAGARGARLVEIAKRRESTPRRRSTATAAASSSLPQARRLRPQNGGCEGEAPLALGNRKKVLAAAGALSVLSLAIGAVALSGHSKARAPVAAVTPALSPLAPPPAAAVAVNPPGTTSMNGAPGTQTAPGQNPALVGQRAGVVANVPLFGPTPMATLEPAPLGPPPTELAAVGAAPTPAPNARTTEERMDDEDEPKSVDRDESFDDTKKKEKSAKSAEATAADVKPWGDGKLHLPTVFRLKLDKPGAALSGKRQAKGFSVVIPGRKVKGSGISITKRDDRIARVRVKNGPDGAHVTFAFRGKVPGYRVRLRKSTVEFFVSAPGGK